MIIPAAACRRGGSGVRSAGGGAGGVWCDRPLGPGPNGALELRVLRLHCRGGSCCMRCIRGASRSL